MPRAVKSWVDWLQRQAKDYMSIRIVSMDGERAQFVRVYYRGGWFEDHDVTEGDPDHAG